MEDIKNKKALEKIVEEFYKNGFVITTIVYSPIKNKRTFKTVIISETDAKTFFNK